MCLNYNVPVFDVYTLFHAGAANISLAIGDL